MEFERLLDADIREIRTKYLWEFAERLGFDGNQVDALLVFDFFNYVRGIKERQKQEKEQAKRDAQPQ